MGLELAIVVVLAIALIVAVADHRQRLGRQPHLARCRRGRPDYFAIGGGLMLAMIMGLTTLVGFDAAANLAEEAKDPFRSVPRAIVGSVVAAAVLGLVFLIALTVAIDDIPAVSASESPVAAIMRDQLGPVMERIAAGRDRVRVLRRRDGDDGDLLADRLRDGARLSASPPTG